MHPFTQRVIPLSAEGAYVILDKARRLEAQGKKIIHLEIGQPDFPTPANVSQAGIEAIRSGITKYTSPAGMQELRAAIADHAGRQRGLNFTPNQVVVGAGSKPGLFFPTLALVDEGDEVMYPDPGFPTYEAMIRVAGGIPVPVPLREKNGFTFDLDFFDEKISKRTKLVVLNSPGNPTGSIIPLKDLEHIAEQVRQHDCWVLSDEIYTRLVYDGQTACSIAQVDGMAERTVIADGFSKTYSMTGWRLGYSISPLDLAERLELLVMHATGCPAAFTQVAALEAINGPQDFITEMVREYRSRRDHMLALVNAIPGMHALKPEGAFYVFVNITSTGLTSRIVAERLMEEAGVAVLAGTDFGAAGEGYIRLVYAVSPETIEEGMQRIKTWMLSLS